MGKDTFTKAYRTHREKQLLEKRIYRRLSSDERFTQNITKKLQGKLRSFQLSLFHALVSLAHSCQISNDDIKNEVRGIAYKM
jgi:hypothetical protein